MYFAGKLIVVVGALLVWGWAQNEARCQGTQGKALPSDADQAWQIILDQTAGPGNRFHSQQEASDAAHEHLNKQESALRYFERAYPNDPRHYSAEIRLATILAAKAKLTHEPALRAESRTLLATLENNAATPSLVKADAGFARVSQSMEDAASLSDSATREELLKTVRKFDADYPGDRRTPNLLTELAGLYDAQPLEKQSLLREAAARTTDEAVRRRIDDDLRRIALLGHPLDLRLQPWDGGPIFDLAAHRGKVVVLLFWASWSLPSLHELARLEQEAKQFAVTPVDFCTVSLDEDKAALAATIKVANLRWPVYCDGRGWQGSLVRSLGINALPTVWVLDKKGDLITLNARGQTAEVIRQVLQP